MSQEFIEIVKNYFLIPVYLFALIIALRHYRKYFDTVLKFFPVLIAYTFFNELLGHFIRYSDNFAFFEDKTFANDIIYNVYDLFYYGFFFLVYWRLANSTKLKTSIKVLGIAVLMSYIISCFFQNPFTVSLFYATSIASFTLAIIVILHWTSRRTDWNWQLEKRNLMFWVSVGLFIFHIIFPILFLTGYLKSEIWYKYNFQTILRVIIVIMYTFFCFGFIASHRRAFN